MNDWDLIRLAETLAELQTELNNVDGWKAVHIRAEISIIVERITRYEKQY